MKTIRHYKNRVHFKAPCQWQKKRIDHLPRFHLHSLDLFVQMVKDPTVLIQLPVPLGDKPSLSLGTISAFDRPHAHTHFEPQQWECSWMAVVQASLTETSHDLRGKRVWSLRVLLLTKQETKMSLQLLLCLSQKEPGLGRPWQARHRLIPPHDSFCSSPKVKPHRRRWSSTKLSLHWAQWSTMGAQRRSA